VYHIILKVPPVKAKARIEPVRLIVDMRESCGASADEYDVEKVAQMNIAGEA